MSSWRCFPSLGISTPSLSAQGEQRRSTYFNIGRDIPAAFPKQTIETRTSAPATTQGSSEKAQKTGASCTTRSITSRLAVPRIIFVDTRPAARLLDELIEMRLLSNQKVTKSAVSG